MRPAEWIGQDLPYEHHPDLLDFKMFFWYALQELYGFTPSRIQLDWCDQIQTHKDDIMLQAPREEGKSMWLCIYCAWRLYLNPRLHFVIVSENEQKASRNSGFIKQLFGSLPELTHLLPQKGQRDSVLTWDTAYAEVGLHASVQCYGISGGIVGAHGHELLVDDVETQKNSASAAQRETLRERVDGLNYIPYRDVEGTRKVFIGTPHDEESIYNDLPQRGCQVLIYPRQYGFHQDHYFGSIAPMFLEDLQAHPELREGGAFGLGSTTDPIRAPNEKLIRDAIKAGRSSWMLQMMLDPRAGLLDAHPLKVQDLIVADVDKDVAPDRSFWSTRNPAKDIICRGRSGDTYFLEDRPPEGFSDWDRKIAFVDPSGRGHGADATSCVILFLKNGTLYLYDILHYTGGYDEDSVLLPMAKKLDAAGPLELYYEDNMGAGMFGALMQPIANKFSNISFNWEENGIHVTGQKEKRIIDSLEPVMNAHRLVIGKRAIESDSRFVEMLPAGHANEYSVFWQMARLTSVRNCLGHDDGLDALASGVQVLKDFIAVDQEDAALETARQRDWAELERERQEWRGAIYLSPHPNQDDMEDEGYGYY